jgi:hypothetical protein
MFDVLGSMARKRTGESSNAFGAGLMGLSVEEVPALLHPENGGRLMNSSGSGETNLSNSSGTSTRTIAAQEKTTSTSSPRAERKAGADVESGETSPPPRRPHSTRIPSLSLGLSAIAKFAEEEEERLMRRLHEQQQQTVVQSQQQAKHDDQGKGTARTMAATAAATTVPPPTKRSKMDKMKSLRSLRLLKRKNSKESSGDSVTKEKETITSAKQSKKEQKKLKKMMKKHSGEAAADIKLADKLTSSAKEAVATRTTAPREECDAKEAEDHRSIQRRRGQTLPAHAPRTYATSS